MVERKNLRLPSSFLYGAASAAHQVEGNNINSDWWHLEQQGKLPVSGNSTEHYSRYKEDFALAKQIGLNAMRISIEWSRIEPVDGKWDLAAIDHYRDVLKSMHSNGLTCMVTLFHFSLPQWLAEKGGMSTKLGVDRLVRFAKFIAEQLGDDIDLWVTINEPEVYVLMSYWQGKWPPFQKNFLGSLRVINNLISAHNSCYDAIKSMRPNAQIGLAKNNVYYEPHRKRNLFDKLAVYISRYYGNSYILSKTIQKSDFIGINYYFYHSLSANLLSGVKLMNESGPRSDMGWRTYPKGLYYLLQNLKNYGKPVYITENGIANARDNMRQDFIYQHLQFVEQALAGGIDVRGYFYWSLTDTYEWHDGYNPKFGLIEVNFETQKRIIRPSAEIFKQIKKRK